MAAKLATQLQTQAGIGPARAKALAKLGLATVEDLLRYYPRQYEDRSLREEIAGIPEGESACFEAMVLESFRVSRIRRGMELCKGRIGDAGAQVAVTFFNQSYVQSKLSLGESYYFYGKLEGYGARRTMTNPYFEKPDEGKLVGSIIPIYSLTAGVTQNLLGGLLRRNLEAASDVAEVLPLEVLTQYRLALSEFAYQNIHFPTSWAALHLARTRLRV